MFPCTIFVPFALGPFFAFDSTPRTRTTTKLLLRPLSIARGQKDMKSLVPQESVLLIDPIP